MQHDYTECSLVPRPTPFFVLRFCVQYNTRKQKSVCTLPLPCIILNANQRTKNGVGYTECILSLGHTFLFTSLSAKGRKSGRSSSTNVNFFKGMPNTEIRPRVFKGTETCGHAMTRKGTPLKTSVF